MWLRTSCFFFSQYFLETQNFRSLAFAVCKIRRCKEGSTIYRLIKSPQQIPIMKMNWLTQHQKPVELRRFVAGESRFESARSVIYVRCRRLKAFRLGKCLYNRINHAKQVDRRYEAPHNVRKKH